MERKDGISVIVCCYNSASRLENTLNHLFTQSVSDTVNWEIIVIDNNSTDNTAETANQLYSNSGSSIPFKVIHESKPGLSNARKAGFDSSQFEFVLMVDDDNWLCPDYLSTVYQRLSQDQTIGMVGGLGIPKLEMEEPAWFNELAYCYATGPQSETGNSGFTLELYGAGLALRMSALAKLETAGFRSLLSDRIGNTLMSGGDTELCHAFRIAGYKLYFDDSISFIHQLPAGRINWHYLRRLFYGFGMMKVAIDIYTGTINNYPMPQDGKLPFWFSRTVYLTRQLLPDLPILLRGMFSNMEGDKRILKAIAQLGHINALVKQRNSVMDNYRVVAKLKTDLTK